MAADQPNKSAVTGGKREEQDVTMTTTMTTTSYHHLLAEMKNTSLKRLAAHVRRGSGQSEREWMDKLLVGGR